MRYAVIQIGGDCWFALMRAEAATSALFDSPHNITGDDTQFDFINYSHDLH